ncbi:MAG: ABC transporter ATP-binding protein [Desulfovibrio sp.]|uniref:ABC transporter ATP-binding protein n=1 Tax=Desulfovibrio sp. 7SRBS1 TaxID=3378064 RepID=UPI003B3D85E6
MKMCVNELAFRYNSAPVLEGVNFHLAPRELLAIMGPNGVGKTTLLKCMNGILAPSCGAVMVGEANVRSLDSFEIARRFGYVAQKSEAGRITVFDAVLMGRRPHIRWRVSENDLKIVDAAIKRLNLEKLSLRYIDSMSGGELQKVCIARALVQEPDILLLDEPTSSLDLSNQIEIMNIIRRVVVEHDVSAVMTIHDINTALRYCDKFLFLKGGRIFAACTQDDVTPEIINEVYGVQVSLQRHEGAPFIIPLN